MTTISLKDEHLAGHLSNLNTLLKDDQIAFGFFQRLFLKLLDVDPALFQPELNQYYCEKHRGDAAEITDTVTLRRLLLEKLLVALVEVNRQDLVGILFDADKEGTLTADYQVEVGYGDTTKQVIRHGLIRYSVWNAEAPYQALFSVLQAYLFRAGNDVVLATRIEHVVQLAMRSGILEVYHFLAGGANLNAKPNAQKKLQQYIANNLVKLMLDGMHSHSVSAIVIDMLEQKYALPAFTHDEHPLVHAARAKNLAHIKAFLKNYPDALTDESLMQQVFMHFAEPEAVRSQFDDAAISDLINIINLDLSRPLLNGQYPIQMLIKSKLPPKNIWQHLDAMRATNGVVDADGNTLMHLAWALEARPFGSQWAELLLSLGAVPDQPNNEGVYPIELEFEVLFGNDSRLLELCSSEAKTALLSSIIRKSTMQFRNYDNINIKKLLESGVSATVDHLVAALEHKLFESVPFILTNIDESLTPAYPRLDELLLLGIQNQIPELVERCLALGADPNAITLEVQGDTLDYRRYILQIEDDQQVQLHPLAYAVLAERNDKMVAIARILFEYGAECDQLPGEPTANWMQSLSDFVFDQHDLAMARLFVQYAYSVNLPYLIKRATHDDSTELLDLYLQRKEVHDYAALNEYALPLMFSPLKTLQQRGWGSQAKALLGSSNFSHIESNIAAQLILQKMREQDFSIATWLLELRDTPLTNLHYANVEGLLKYSAENEQLALFEKLLLKIDFSSMVYNETTFTPQFNFLSETQQQQALAKVAWEKVAAWLIEWQRPEMKGKFFKPAYDKVTQDAHSAYAKVNKIMSDYQSFWGYFSHPMRHHRVFARKIIKATKGASPQKLLQDLLRFQRELLAKGAKIEGSCHRRLMFAIKEVEQVAEIDGLQAAIAPAA